MVAHLLWEQEAAGSSPASPTTTAATNQPNRLDQPNKRPRTIKSQLKRGTAGCLVLTVSFS
jgi:hypothetical protein